MRGRGRLTWEGGENATGAEFFLDDTLGGRFRSDRANLVLLARSIDRERDGVAALRRALKGQPNRSLTNREADRIFSFRRLVKCVQGCLLGRGWIAAGRWM